MTHAQANIITPPRIQRLGLWFGILAAVVHAIAYGLYGWYVVKGEIDTNVVSWAMFSGEFILLLIYRDFTHDWVKDLLNWVCSAAAVVILVLVVTTLLRDGKEITLEIHPFDLGVIAFDIVVLIVWMKLRKDNESAWYVDMLLQVDIALAFLPIVRTTREDPSSEWWVPWAIWTLAYTLQSLCVLMRWDGKWETYTTPVHHVGWHLAMAMMIYFGLTVL